MFRSMRRSRQQLSQEETIKILEQGTSGVLAVSGDDEYPYTVPLSYVYHDGRIYFHCAASGHKLDGIRRNPKVSFCVIAKDAIVPEEFTTYFCSAIAFGKARVLQDEAEKYNAMKLLSMRYSPTESARMDDEIARNRAQLTVIELQIEHLTGKAAIELVR